MQDKENQKLKRRVIALLSREEIEFLDKLSTDSSFSTGHKLPRVDSISALVDAAMAMELSGLNIHSKEELISRMLELVRSRMDRRNFPRIMKNLNVEFRVMESLKGFEASVTEDISLGGFRMDVPRLTEPVSLHQVIEVKLSDEDDSKPLKAIGRVIWIRNKEKNSGFEIGVRLTYVQKDDLKKFNEYLLDDMSMNSEEGVEGEEI